ncbi:hypothetical protein TNCV_1545891 [Trichonephila clavipes]|nr:hypothetical protein TNCV_1545891 [Trichonephila clavipes]
MYLYLFPADFRAITGHELHRLNPTINSRTQSLESAGCGMSQQPIPCYHGKSFQRHSFSPPVSVCGEKFISTAGIAVIAFSPCKGSERVKRYRTLPNESTCVVYTFIESFA